MSAPVPLAAVAVLVGGYLFAVGRDRRGWRRGRTLAWLAGCAALAVALGPFAGGSGDPRAHMAQHLLLGMAAPLALALGAPVTLLLRASPPRARRWLGRVLHAAPLRLLAHPVTAALLSTGGLALTLLTPLYAAADRYPVLHHGIHLHYLAAGYLLAWAVAGPDPAPRRPGLAVRVGALLGAAAGHAVLAKLLYAHAGALPPGLPDRDVAALRAAAELMWYGGDVAELLLATALFAAWYRRTRPRPARPGLMAGRLPAAPASPPSVTTAAPATSASRPSGTARDSIPHRYPAGSPATPGGSGVSARSGGAQPVGTFPVDGGGRHGQQVRHDHR